MIPLPDIDLLERYLANDLSEEEDAQFQERLKNEPTLAEQLVWLAHEEAQIVEWALAQREVRRLHTERALLEETLPKPTSWKPMPRIASLAAAVLLCLLTGTLVIILPNRTTVAPSTKQARIKESIGEVAVISPNGTKQKARAGQALQPGQRLATGEGNSFAVLELSDSTKLELGAETVLELPKNQSIFESDSPQLISLLQGFVRASVKHKSGQSPLLLDTPHARIEAQESVCSSWSDSAGTRVELENGQAEFIRHIDGQSVTIHQGNFVTASPQSQRLIPQPLPKPVTEASLTLDHLEGPLLTVAFSPDGREVATGGWLGSIRIWDAETGQLLRQWQAHGPKGPKIFAIAYSEDGQKLVSCGHDKMVKVWNPHRGELIHALPKFRSEITSIAVSSTGIIGLVSVHEQKKPHVQLWDLDTGEHLHSFRGKKQRFSALAFSPDGRQLSAGDRDGHLFIWDIDRKKKIRSMRPHRKMIHSLTYSPSGDQLVSGGSDRTLRIWSTDNYKKSEKLEGHFRTIRSIDFSPDGMFLAVATDCYVKLWTLEKSQELATLRGDAYQVTQVCFSDDGSLLVTSGWKRQAKIWDLEQIFGEW